PDELRAVGDEVLANARRWLTATRPASTEDATFRLLGLVWASAPAADVAAGVNDLRRLQRIGGGWAQLPSYLPDAYSTGEALYALREAGAAGDLAGRRGIGVLRSTQRSDR